MAVVTTGGAAVPEEARPKAPPGGPGTSAGRPGRVVRRRARRDARPRLSWRIKLRRDKTLLLMVLPAMALLLVFNYLPMFGTVSAFEFYDPIYGFLHSNWVGFQNFTDLFRDQLFWHAFENTLVLSFVQLVLYFPVPILLAVLLNSVLGSKLRSFIQAVVYLPHFFSWVLVITIFDQMLGGAGLLNEFLRRHHMATWDIMTNPSAFKYLVTAQAVWKEAGWGIIVFLAALAAIDPQLYESAAVDGAGRWSRIWHITLPGMRGMIVLMLVLRLGNALSVGFEQMLIQRNAVGAQSSEVLDTFAYYFGIGDGNFGYGAAAGLFKGAISLILILMANRMAHALGEDGLYQK